MTTSKAQQTAQKIILAAAVLFDKKGYYNVSIKEIAAKASVNSALISYHFGGKQQLYKDVLTRQALMVDDLQKNIMSRECSALEKLRIYIADIMQLHFDSKQHVRLLYLEMLNPTGICDQYIENRLGAIHSFTAALVKNAIAEHSIHPLPEPDYAAFILESITVLSFLVRKQIKILSPNNLTERELMDKVIAFYLNSLAIVTGDVQHVN